MGDPTESDIVRIEERHTALSRRFDEAHRDLKGDIGELKTDMEKELRAVREEVASVSGNQKWVALAVIGAVVGAVMRMVLGGSGM